MKSAEIFNGTDGTIWLATDTEEVEVASLEKFTLKQKNIFDDVNTSNFKGKKRKLLGYELSGTMSIYKIDSVFNRIMERCKNGEQPEISFIGKAENPTTNKLEKIKVIGVTIDEKDLMSLEQKTPTKEEIPFEAEDYKWIDLY